MVISSCMKNDNSKYNAHIGKRILVVDDSESIHSLFKSFFDYHGFKNVGTAGCGEQAIEEVRINSPDVILMDTQMPGLEGPKVYEGLREMGFNGLCYGMSGVSPTYKKQVEESWMEVGAKRFFPKDQIATVDGSRLVLDAIVVDSLLKRRGKVPRVQMPTRIFPKY